MLWSALILLSGCGVLSMVVSLGCLNAVPFLRRRAVLVASVVVATVALYASLGRPHMPWGEPWASVLGQPRSADAHDWEARRELHRVTQRLELKLAQAPEDAQGWLALARAFYVQQRYDDALDIYRTWARLRPEHTEIFLYLGACLVARDAGHVSEEARQALSRIPSSSPHYAPAQRLLRQRPF